jgi:predicted thioesterase
MNDFNLEIGMAKETKSKVTTKNIAMEYGSSSVKVFGTPAMVALMEESAAKAVDKYLPEGFATVGVHLDIKHIAATPIGMNVTADAKLTGIDGKRLFFDVEASDEKEKIGSGTHQRYIIELDKFLGKVEEKNKHY